MSVMADAVVDTDGVRQPATAAQMQRFADAIGCMLLTPLLADLVWRQAALRFDAVVSVGGRIVAQCEPAVVSAAIDQRIAEAGGAPADGIVACVGKQWVVTNALDRRGLRYGRRTAANYGWFSSMTPAARCGVTGRDVHPWQTIGTRHNDEHVDPSQVVRLVDRTARLDHADGASYVVDLVALAQNPELVPLVNHDGPLRVTRQPSVEGPTEPVGVIVLPGDRIVGRASGRMSNGRA